VSFFDPDEALIALLVMFGVALVALYISLRSPRPLRIYVACSSRELYRVSAAMNAVEARGHVLTHDWTVPILEARAQGHEEHEMGFEIARQCAEADLKGIERADVVWVLIPQTITVGLWVEIGYAIRARKPIIISGPDPLRSNVFLFVDGIYDVPRSIKDETSALAYIETRTWRRPSRWW
jgi:hypothetical protein